MGEASADGSDGAAAIALETQVVAAASSTALWKRILVPMYQATSFNYEKGCGQSIRFWCLRYQLGIEARERFSLLTSAALAIQALHFAHATPEHSLSTFAGSCQLSTVDPTRRALTKPDGHIHLLRARPMMRLSPREEARPRSAVYDYVPRLAGRNLITGLLSADDMQRPDAPPAYSMLILTRAWRREER